MNQEFIAKIEGHGNLTVDWRKGQVKLNILEGERLFEGMLVGRTAEEMHWITPRICGVCPTAHHLASLRAVEDALGIKPNQTTLLLRDLMQCGQMIQSHTLHLFFLSLPDYLGIDRGTELVKKNPSLFQKALQLKEVSDMIVDVVGGRHTHPTTSTIGGFHRIPTKTALKKLLKKVKAARSAARETVELALHLDYPELKVDLILAAQEGDNLITALASDIENKHQSSLREYKKDIEEEVRNYSTAKFGTYRGKEMLVGALARLALYVEHRRTIARDKLDFTNPFHNNLAQAIEIAYYQERAQELIERLLDSTMDGRVKKPASHPSLHGIGVIEAPRGGLYHEVYLDKKQIITEANIVTPTVQNLTSIEKSAQALLDQTKNRSRKEMERLLIMLVRAYDPCITCSVH